MVMEGFNIGVNVQTQQTEIHAVQHLFYQIVKTLWYPS